MTKSPNDKIPVQRLLVPPYILRISRILTWISPTLASRFGARLFLTPFRYELPKREQEMDAQSRQWKVRVPDINREIVVYQYGDSPKKVLLVHGWSGRGTQMAVIAKHLLENGY